MPKLVLGAVYGGEQRMILIMIILLPAFYILGKYIYNKSIIITFEYWSENNLGLKQATL